MQKQPHSCCFLLRRNWSKMWRLCIS